MKRSDYESAIQSFERARAQLQEQRIEITHRCI